MVKGAKREVHREGLSNVNVLNHAKSIYYIYNIYIGASIFKNPQNRFFDKN